MRERARNLQNSVAFLVLQARKTLEPHLSDPNRSAFAFTSIRGVPEAIGISTGGRPDTARANRRHAQERDAVQRVAGTAISFNPPAASGSQHTGPAALSAAAERRPIALLRRSPAAATFRCHQGPLLTTLPLACP